MWDKELNTINTVTAKGFERPLVESTLDHYKKSGRAATVSWLEKENGLPSASATDMVNSIRQEMQRLHRKAILVRSIVCLVLLSLTLLALLTASYISGSLLALITLRQLFRLAVISRRGLKP